MSRAVPIFWTVKDMDGLGHLPADSQLSCGCRPSFSPASGWAVSHNPPVLKCHSICLIPCRDTYLSSLGKHFQMVLSEMRMLAQVVRAVISLPKAGQSCRAEPWVTPWVSLQPPALVCKKNRANLKNQVGNWKLLAPFSPQVRDVSPTLNFSRGTYGWVYLLCNRVV